MSISCDDTNLVSRSESVDVFSSLFHTVVLKEKNSTAASMGCCKRNPSTSRTLNYRPFVPGPPNALARSIYILMNPAMAQKTHRVLEPEC